jgi:hypothetical protein
MKANPIIVRSEAHRFLDGFRGVARARAIPGSAGVSPAVFGVPPNTFRPPCYLKATAGQARREAGRETRPAATGTVALPMTCGAVRGSTENATRPGRWQGVQGVALVITLLLLSVITFLAIAFLAMSRQNKSAVSATLDLATSRAAAEAGQARAQAEIIASMLAHGDALAYDIMVSHAYRSPGYTNAEKYYDPNNVNYDFLANTTTPFSSSNNSLSWAQMIANLFYDPCPPVFVVTNPAYPNRYDFRYYVDVDRNGRFETNGDQPPLNDLGQNIGPNQVLNGEPEFIGLLKNPLLHHSGSNTFTARYAYLVLPIGKTLDINYIGNFLKNAVMNFSAQQPANTPAGLPDGFARDQGIGSWELNLAAVLDAISPWAYENIGNPPYANTVNRPYTYYPPLPDGNANSGYAFDDAQSILHYRYEPATYNLGGLNAAFPSNVANFGPNNIDIYCVDAPEVAPFDYNFTNAAQPSPFRPWPGSYETNMFYDVQDLFDPNKTSPFFTNRMILAAQRTNTFDRYTFMRLLSCIGMGSSPEYGVWVYGDSFNLNPLLITNPPLVLRTKVNINYDNTAQITNVNAPYVPMPTNLAPWQPTTFFLNAAELLLRSKIFTFTNLAGTNALANNNAFGNSFINATFGVTNIPIYRAYNPGIRYDEGIHRMLQLAANIYDATLSNSYPSPSITLPAVRHPTVFRPRFGLVNTGTTNVGIDIIGYVQVTNATLAYKQILSHGGFKELPAVLQDLQQSPGYGIDDNAWGIPWVVAAEKGLPQFNQYSYNSRALFTRKLLFVRYGTPAAPVTNRPPEFTNQFYCMSISNNLGMDAWNAYPSNFTGSKAYGGYTTCYISNFVTIQVTNNYDYGFTTLFTNVMTQYPQSGQTLAQPFNWKAWNGITGLSAGTNANGFVTFFPTNIISLQACYYSEATKRLVFLTNGLISSNGFLLADMAQSTSTGWPVHNWTLNVTNHVVYALFDGSINDGVVLDFVNLGPFGSSLSFSAPEGNQNEGLGFTQPAADYWSQGGATDRPGSPMSTGMLNQVMNSSYNTPADLPYRNALIGSSNTSISSWSFGAPVDPSNIVEQLQTWVANDPMVHYSLDDLTWPGHTSPQPTAPASLLYPLTNNLGTVSARYAPWGAQDTIGLNMLFKDPLMFSPTNWAFPTNKFPGLGWIGRVHRGTPWQTVYLKADGVNSQISQALWTNVWVKSPETYPTNDWSLLDVFTTAPDDKAARGLLSVNQTNDAAWAAVFAGVIAPTNQLGGVPIMPNANPIDGIDFDYTNLMDGPNGINTQRTNYPNGIFHKVGDILAASALTTTSPFLIENLGNNAVYPDEVVERIPQQTLSLLKVGEPQFVIFAWGQALKPRGQPYLVSGLNYGMYTNYEITGECLTRTVCHLVHTNGLKMVIDSYNVESGNP